MRFQKPHQILKNRTSFLIWCGPLVDRILFPLSFPSHFFNWFFWCGFVKIASITKWQIRFFPLVLCKCKVLTLCDKLCAKIRNVKLEWLLLFRVKNIDSHINFIYRDKKGILVSKFKLSKKMFLIKIL